MSRSIWTHSDAIETVFYPLDLDEDDLSYGAWGDHICGIQEAFKRKFPSMCKCDYWPEKESNAIVENEHCMVVISDYCGLISLGVVALDASLYEGLNALANYWTQTNAAPFLCKQYSELRKVATFSNGESIYEQTGESL